MAIASRYARALAEVLGAQGDFGAMQQELDDFAGAGGKAMSCGRF